MNKTTTKTSSRILIYETSLSFLKGACSSQFSRSPSEAGLLQMTVDDSMASNGVINAIIESLECRRKVLELSNKLQLSNDPDFRTAIRRDEERLASLLVSIFSSKSDEQAVLRLEGDSAQFFLDVIQEKLDGGFIEKQEHTRVARRIVRKLSESCDSLPSSLFIAGVEERDEHPTFGGGFGDIYRASYDGQRVALKRMRHFLRGSDLRRTRSILCREALVWRALRHPHILPFLGIDAESFPSSLCLVSPWMEHGTVINYLKTHGHANVDKLLYEVAQGLEYLHSHNLVHGDLRGANILIKEDWTACLNDFGLSIFSDATATMSTNRAGSLYWMAPELLDPDRFNLKFARTPATDVYAFGCVCVELYTTRPPFSDVSETAALLKVLNGERPERPPAMSDMLWENVKRFWAQTHAARPSTQSVVQSMVWPNLDSRSSWLQCLSPLSDPQSVSPSFTPAEGYPTPPPTSETPPSVGFTKKTAIPLEPPWTHAKQGETALNVQTDCQYGANATSLPSPSLAEELTGAVYLSQLLKQPPPYGSTKDDRYYSVNPALSSWMKSPVINGEDEAAKVDKKAAGGGLGEGPQLGAHVQHFREINGGIGGEGGDGDIEGGPGGVGQGPKVLHGLLLAEAEGVHAPIKQFCQENGLSHKIHHLLEEYGFETAGAILEVPAADLKDAGFKPGQIAELTRALKGLLRKSQGADPSLRRSNAPVIK
ncbi:Kinase-like protein [Mycena sanguinolenta]|uniref:Kinase-like protein n=1 Tax=Mycena sanguinolenta TaxID=230812 RepID=A0A8H7CBX8_9AGAR|nr:Kinase-like protein [Mycena sanguinolenta]